MLNFGEVKSFSGHVCGFQHPAIAVQLKRGGSPEKLSHSLAKFAGSLVGHVGPEALLWFAKASTKENLAKHDWFLPLLVGLHVSVSLPEIRHMTFQNVGDQKTTIVIFEAFDHSFLLKSLKFLQISFSSEDFSEEHILSQFAALKKFGPSVAKSGTNTRHLVKAAWSLDIPICVLPDLTLNFGMGVRALAMLSSITERTGALAIKRARDKATTHEFLAMLGLPVTEQRVVETLEQARQFTRIFGYPVVVKPRALDGGEGVTTEIRSDAGLEQALQKVSTLSQKALIERQLQGDEYRLLYVNGKLISVHQRIPAQVSGNGRDTVEELVIAENARRRAAAQTGYTNIPMTIGEDAINQLASQGLDPSSVPKRGTIVRLATVPQVKTGGAARAVRDMSKIHPQILSTARQAVRLLGLDVGGVDIITTDIGKSLHETGGAITEVNAQPQVNRLEDFDVHVRVLQALTDGNGRIPCVLILADNERAASVLSALADRLGECLQGTGLLLADSENPPPAAARFGCVANLNGRPALLAFRDVSSIVAVVPMSHVVADGLPLDRFHLTVILDAFRAAELAELAGPLLRPHLAGTVILPSGNAAVAAFSKAVPPMPFSLCDDVDNLSQKIVEVLQAGSTLREGAYVAGEGN
jgi:D-alanine-D-alanine ligase-like ATP-grasp enzyme